MKNADTFEIRHTPNGNPFVFDKTLNQLVAGPFTCNIDLVFIKNKGDNVLVAHKEGYEPFPNGPIIKNYGP